MEHHFAGIYALAPRHHRSGRVIVHDYERAVEFRGGVSRGQLGSGRYRLWFWGDREIVVFDARSSVLTIGNQKLLTSDGVTVTLSVVCEYQIADAALLMARVADAGAKLYEEVQLATRECVARRPLDELLNNRAPVGQELTEAVSTRARDYGITVARVAIKDFVLSNRVRDLLMKEVESRRLAQAGLVGAREEIATLRALSNAARLTRQSPELLRLRELEIARSMASNQGNTLILGVPAGAPIPISPCPKPNGAQPDDDDSKQGNLEAE